MIFPFIFPILFPFSFMIFIVISLFSSVALQAWWPTRLVCVLFGYTPILLISRGETSAGFLRKNAIGNVIAYEGIIPDFGSEANEDGTLKNGFHDKWIPMP